MKVTFNLYNSSQWLDNSLGEIILEAPSINTALIRLSLETDLSKVTSIYISAECEEEEDD